MHREMARHVSCPTFWTYWHVALRSLIPTFAFVGYSEVESHTLPNICWKCHVFSQNFNPPKTRSVVTLRWDRCLGCFEAPGHRWSWRSLQPFWTEGAPQPPSARCSPPSAAAFCLRRFPRGRRQLSSTGSTNERTMKMLWTQPLQTCSKQNMFTNTRTPNNLQSIVRFTTTIPSI